MITKIEDKSRIVLIAETKEDAMNIGKISNEIGHSMMIKEGGDFVSIDFDINEIFELQRMRLNK